MSDLPAASAPSPSPGPAPAPAADPQIAAAREAWLSYGYPAEAFDQALSGSEPTPEPAAAAAHPIVGLGPDIHRAGELIQAMTKAGMDPQAIKAAAELDGLVYTPAGPDTRTPDEIEFDLAFGAPPTPDGYSVNFRGTYATELPPDEFHAIDLGVREGLHAMGFSPAIGSAVAEMGFADAEVWQSYDESSRQLWDMQQSAELGRLVPDAREAIKNAAALIAVFRDQKPKLVADLIERGVFRGAAVVAQLHLQAERMLQRAAMAERRKGGPR